MRPDGEHVGERSCLTNRSFERHGQKPSLQQGVPPPALPPQPSTHSPGDRVRPSRETPEPSSSPSPFLQHGHRLHAQFSRPASHLRIPARLLSTGILLKKFIYPGVVGFPGAGQHCQESEKGKASARLRHRGCRRTAQFPSKPVPDL